MRKTKIVATLGPATSKKGIITELIKSGLDVVRLNFSHGSYEEHGKIIEIVKEVEEELCQPIGIMLDTRGAEIRTGPLPEGPIQLTAGEEITLTTADVTSKPSLIHINYEGLPGDVEPGCEILLDDGLISLKVLSISGREIRCEVINGGVLGSQKGVNIPGIAISMPGLTRQDRQDIEFGLKHGIHMIAASFMRKAVDVIEIRKLLERKRAHNVKIFSKIENHEGVNNIDEIIEVSDGIMVARGDLGVELPVQKVPVIQKLIINKCNQKARPVITATQMLDSMIRNPRPTRAEASDVANAIYDGTDATMLSGETAIGSYPVAAVKTMADIAGETENSPAYCEEIQNVSNIKSSTVTEAISNASCKMASDLEAKAIITATDSGYTARMVSKNRPLTPIIAATPNYIVQHTLTVNWGVYPYIVEKSKTTDEMMENAIDCALDHGLVEIGDLVTVTAGVPIGTPGTTNLIEVDIVGKPLVQGQGTGYGIVTGKARFADTAGEAVEKMEEGDILVTSRTDEDYNPALEKAGGIITTEGDLTCHAAMMGLTLDIPVVVKAGDIRRAVEEGEVITLDGIKGLIYRGEVNIK